MNMITPSAVIPVIPIEAEVQPSNPVGLVAGLFAGFLDFGWNDRSRNVMTKATTERSI
jgi:hypothetical protein